MSASIRNGQPAADAAELLRYRQALAAAGIGVWEMDLATSNFLWDHHCRTLFGLDTDSPVLYADAVQYIHPEDRQRVETGVQDALAGKKNGHYDESYRTLGPDGVLRQVRFSGQVEFGAGGAAVRFSGVAQDVSAWTSIQQKAEAVERIAQTALESTGSGWFRQELPGGAFEHSPEIARIMTGDAGKALSRDQLSAYIHPDDLQIRMAAYAEAEKTDFIDYTVRFRWTNGSLHWVRITGRYHRNSAGERYLFTGTAQDVSALKAAERDALLKDRAVAASADGIVITGADTPDSPIMYVNEAFERMTGYTKEEIIGQDCRFLQNDDQDQPDLKRLRAALNAGQSCTVTLRNYKKDGTLFYNELSVSPVVDGGKLVHFVGIQKDVTTRLQTDEALRQSEQHFRSIFNGQFLFLAILAPDGEVLDINELPLQAAGISRADVLGKKFWDTAWWRDLPEMRGGWPTRLQVAATADGPVFSEDLFQTATGEVRTADAAITAVRSSDGAVEFFIVQASDVTERKKAEAALRESEERYQSFVHQSSEGIWRFEIPEPIRFDMPVEEQLDLVFNHAYLAECNDAFAQMYGFDKAADLHGKRIQDFMPRDADGEAYIRAFIENGYRLNGAVSKEIHRDGSDVYILNNLVGIMEDGAVRRAWGTQRDVSGEKAAQRALEESEFRLRELTETLPAILWVTEPDGTCTYLNQHWYDLTGQRQDEALGFGWLEMTHPDDKQRTGKLFLEANREQKRFKASYRLRTKDGSYRWAIDIGQPRFAPDGAYRGMIGTVVDMHEQYAAEEKLRESEQQFRDFSNNLHNLAWIADADGYIFWYNQRWYDYTGTTLEEMKGWGWEKVHHPDHIAPVVAFVKDAWTRNVPWELTFPLRGADGEYRWFLTRGVPVFDESGKRTRWIGTNTDIHERILAEEAVRKSEASFRQLADSVPQIVWVTRPDGYHEYYNKRWYDFTGVPRGSTDGEGWNGIFHPDDQEHAWTLWRHSLATGDPYHIRYRLRHHSGEYRWTLGRALPIRDEDGTIVKWYGTCTDIHEQVQADEALRLSEQKFRSVIQSAPAAIGLFMGRDLVIESPNQTFIDIVGKGWDVVGKPLREAMPELVTEGQPFLKILDDVFTTGVPFVSPAAQVKIFRDGVMTDNWYNITYTPLFNEQGEVYAILDIAIDVTEQVRAQIALEASETQFRSLIEEAPVATCLFVGRELRIEVANSAMIAVMGKGPEVIGKPLLEALPEIADQPFAQILTTVYETGENFEAKARPAKLIIHGQERHFFFDYIFKPLRNAVGEVWAIIDMTVDVTASVEARRELEESEQKLRSLVEGAPFPIGLYVGREMRIQLANRSIIKTWGKGNDVIGKTYFEVLPELAGTDIYGQLIGVYETGKPFHAKNQRVDLVINGELTPHFFNYSFTPVRDADGKVYGVMNTAANVTDIALARQRAEDAEASLRGAIELADLATWEVDAASGTGDCSERLRVWIGMREDEEPLAAFMESVHVDDKTRVAESIARTLALEGNGHYDEEYRLVNRITSRQRIIHAHGRTFTDAAGKPVRVSGTAQDVTRERALQAELERQVAERTAELADSARNLQRSNEDLSQYAYVASHDLQEPLRKIRMFSDILQKQQNLPPSAPPVIDRITQAAARMSGLIQSLLEFSRLLNSDAMRRPVDLNEVVGEIVRDFDLLVTEKGAKVQVGDLPMMDAVALQMNQLFYNLLGNALKFSKPDVPPEIRVESTMAEPQTVKMYLPTAAPGQAYHHITVRDNGIGFETRYADQIFEVFKRLHTRDVYPGSGIGLALCRRIVDNHGGALWAESTPGEGTTFNILLPTLKEAPVPGLPEQLIRNYITP